MNMVRIALIGVAMGVLAISLPGSEDTSARQLPPKSTVAPVYSQPVASSSPQYSQPVVSSSPAYFPTVASPSPVYPQPVASHSPQPAPERVAVGRGPEINKEEVAPPKVDEPEENHSQATRSPSLAPLARSSRRFTWPTTSADRSTAASEPRRAASLAALNRAMTLDPTDNYEEVQPVANTETNEEIKARDFAHSFQSPTSTRYSATESIRENRPTQSTADLEQAEVKLTRVLSVRSEANTRLSVQNDEPNAELAVRDHQAQPTLAERIAKKPAVSEPETAYRANDEVPRSETNSRRWMPR